MPSTKLPRQSAALENPKASPEEIVIVAATEPLSSAPSVVDVVSKVEVLNEAGTVAEIQVAAEAEVVSETGSVSEDRVDGKVAWVPNLTPALKDLLKKCFPEIEFRYVSPLRLVESRQAQIRSAPNSCIVLSTGQQPQGLSELVNELKLPVFALGFFPLIPPGHQEMACPRMVLLAPVEQGWSREKAFASKLLSVPQAGSSIDRAAYERLLLLFDQAVPSAIRAEFELLGLRLKGVADRAKILVDLGSLTFDVGDSDDLQRGALAALAAARQASPEAFIVTFAPAAVWSESQASLIARLSDLVVGARLPINLWHHFDSIYSSGGRLGFDAFLLGYPVYATSPSLFSIGQGPISPALISQIPDAFLLNTLGGDAKIVSAEGLPIELPAAMEVCGGLLAEAWSGGITYTAPPAPVAFPTLNSEALAQLLKVDPSPEFGAGSGLGTKQQETTFDPKFDQFSNPVAQFNLQALSKRWVVPPVLDFSPTVLGGKSKVVLCVVSSVEELVFLDSLAIRFPDIEFVSYPLTKSGAMSEAIAKAYRTLFSMNPDVAVPSLVKIVAGMAIKPDGLLCFDNDPALVPVIERAGSKGGMRRILVVLGDARSRERTYQFDRILCLTHTDQQYFSRNNVDSEAAQLLPERKRDRASRQRLRGLMGLQSDRKTVVVYLDGEQIPAELRTQVQTLYGMKVGNYLVERIVEFVDQHNVQCVLSVAGNIESLWSGAGFSRALLHPGIKIDLNAHCFSGQDLCELADLLISSNTDLTLQARLTSNCPTLSLARQVTGAYVEASATTHWLHEGLTNGISVLLSSPDDAAAPASDAQAAFALLPGKSANLSPETALLSRLMDFGGAPFNCLGINSGLDAATTSQRYLLPLLNARRRVRASGGLDVVHQLFGVDLFMTWGWRETTATRNVCLLSQYLNVPCISLEDGFIRSVGIGLSGEPGLSLIFDTRTPYFDATTPSLMESILNSDMLFSAEELQSAADSISLIRKTRVSKYNHAQDVPLKVGKPERRKVLVVDQRAGDASIDLGLAREATFIQMLKDAILENPDADVIVKQHPDGLSGKKESCLNSEVLRPLRGGFDNLHIVDYDINPHSLFDAVDTVYVVTSGMGFEALCAGKKVVCYGVPFYSNWGLTIDKKRLSRRERKRSLEEVFHVAYVMLSRYFSPSLGRRCSIAEVVEHIVGVRDSI